MAGLCAPQTDALVSVIIPCYNHGRFLAESIDSVLSQHGVNTEIIVVDDGSADDTRIVAELYPAVKYVYQNNQGLSAARNTGIELCTGNYLVFLDADDWLFPGALAISLHHLCKNAQAAFVSGGHRKINKRQILEEVKMPVEDNHYLHLLQGNYIGMHATVMYRRFVFNIFRFDVSLKACEDYDIYLKIARRYPVIHHQELIAGYRIHGTNMSGNIPLMLDNVLMVLERQRKDLVNEAEQAALITGFSVWKEYYSERLYDKLRYTSRNSGDKISKSELNTLWHHHKPRYIKLIIQNPVMAFKSSVKKIIPDFILRIFYKAGLYKNFIPAPGKINMGDFNRTTPYSHQFGYDRGGPVDRYYIENFLQKQAHHIHGRVLEIGDNEYTLKYGGSKVEKSDVLHIEEGNAKATFVGDLSNAPQLPDNSFDCIVLTQTLHLIYEYKEALRTCYRVLKPGGVLLITVPGISHIDQGEWKKIWLWSFTESSITKLLEDTFPGAERSVEIFGNVLVATAFLYGIGLPELKKEQMDQVDEHYQVIITVSAIKPAHS